MYYRKLYNFSSAIAFRLAFTASEIYEELKKNIKKKNKQKIYIEFIENCVNLKSKKISPIYGELVYVVEEKSFWDHDGHRVFPRFRLSAEFENIWIAALFFSSKWAIKKRKVNPLVVPRLQTMQFFSRWSLICR